MDRVKLTAETVGLVRREYVLPGPITHEGADSSFCSRVRLVYLAPPIM